VDHRTYLGLEDYLFLSETETRSLSPQNPNFIDGNILKPCTYIARTPREVASRGKNREMDTCLAPALASYGGSRGASHTSRFFDVLKGASLRVARSDWTAARLLFKMDNEKCRLLIDLYKDHRLLCDLKHKNYHNSTRREDSWKEISSILNITVSELK
jgi:hypothetical protein